MRDENYSTESWPMFLTTGFELVDLVITCLCCYTSLRTYIYHLYQISDFLCFCFLPSGFFSFSFLFSSKSGLVFRNSETCQSILIYTMSRFQIEEICRILQCYADVNKYYLEAIAHSEYLKYKLHYFTICSDDKICHKLKLATVDASLLLFRESVSDILPFFSLFQ